MTWQKDLSDYEIIDGGGEEERVVIDAAALDTFTIPEELKGSKCGGNIDISFEENIRDVDDTSDLSIEFEEGISGGNFELDNINSDYNAPDVTTSSTGGVISLSDWIKIGGKVLSNSGENSGEYSGENSSNNSSLEITFTGGHEKEKVLFGKELMPTVVSECSLIRETSKEAGAVCSPHNVVKSLAAALDIPTGKTDAETIEKAKEATGCKTERCLLRSKNLEEEIGPQVIKDVLARDFKIGGPVDITLMSNINIDDATLNQWMNSFKEFFNFGFTMSDFTIKPARGSVETDRSGNGLGRSNIIDVIDSGYKTAGSVLNTDLHAGAGKHWMAMFIDARDPLKITIEFFNSSGNMPQKNFKEWMSAAATLLKEKFPAPAEIREVIVSKIMHQHSRTECGVYALYYIWARLNGIPYTAFSHRVPDELMFEFRQHLFAGQVFKPGEKWDFERYKRAIGGVKWESGYSY